MRGGGTPQFGRNKMCSCVYSVPFSHYREYMSEIYRYLLIKFERKGMLFIQSSVHLIMGCSYLVC